jgi:hypothetical protein
VILAGDEKIRSLTTLRPSGTSITWLTRRYGMRTAASTNSIC